MLEDLKDLIVTSKLYLTLYFVAAFCFSTLLLVLSPFPFNYALMWLPYSYAFHQALKELGRQIKLGYVHDRAREIPQEQMDEALDYVERERRKTRPLP
jgi:hypothetical protein